MRILTFNCGSSSLKFHLLELESSKKSVPVIKSYLASGIVNRIGESNTEVKFSLSSKEDDSPTSSTVQDHQEATRLALDWLSSSNLLKEKELSAVAHRIVHGGELTGPLFLDQSSLRTIENLSDLAPLHNEPSLNAIRAVRQVLGESTPMIAVFDTDFHKTMPEKSCNYAIPLELATKYHIKRYGFHGIAHRYMLEQYCRISRTPVEKARIITAQLGSGCSLTAIENGRSFDTTMGLTPLEGLMMATRSGDTDPSLQGYLAHKENVSDEEIEHWLNTKCGLLGVSGLSKDMEELLGAEEKGNSRAALAVSMFCYKVVKYLGAYLSALGGAQAIIFGGGIGENSIEIRSRICKAMQWSGISLDEEANLEERDEARKITLEDSKIKICVIPVHEEVIIAQDAVNLLQKQRKLE